MELISLSVCDLNTNKAGNLRRREPTVPFPTLPSESRGSQGDGSPLLTTKKHSIYYNMSHTPIIETNNENIIDVSSVVVKPTIAQQWVKIGGEPYQPTKPKKNKKIVPNNDNIQTGLWE